jgi:diguanylate cyclase (GGDEF)-like protein
MLPAVATGSGLVGRLPRMFNVRLEVTWYGCIALACGAALACARAATRAGNPRGRTAWRWQSAACAAWATAPAAWVLGLPPAIAQVGRLGFLVCAAVGLWLTFRGSDRRVRVRMFLDGVVGALAALVIAWALVFDAVVRQQHPNGLTLAASVAFPLGALVLLIFFVLLSLTEFRPGRRQMPAFYVAGLAAIAVSDVRFAQHATGVLPFPRALDSVGWLVGFALLAAAARSYKGTTPRQSARTTAWWITYAPYLVLLPAALTIGVQAIAGDGTPLPELVACGLIILIVLGRQVLLLAENRSLVAQLAARERELHHLALHDPLTGLGNRALLAARLDATLARPHRGWHPTALLMCDLDDFKVINDALGHHAGDEVLVEVAGRLRQAVRSTDVVIRLGGDEFAVIMTCGVADAFATATRVWGFFQRPFTVHDQSVSLSASIGVVTRADAVGSPSGGTGDLLKAADIAMYQAKRHGKNTIEMVEPGSHPSAPASGNLGSP